jgi:hypothetical protein
MAVAFCYALTKRAQYNSKASGEAGGENKKMKKGKTW